MHLERQGACSSPARHSISSALKSQKSDAGSLSSPHGSDTVPAQGVSHELSRWLNIEDSGDCHDYVLGTVVIDFLIVVELFQQ